MTTNRHSNYASIYILQRFGEIADRAAGAVRFSVTEDVKQSDLWPEGGEANI